jgi:hypothetical protein
LIVIGISGKELTPLLEGELLSRNPPKTAVWPDFVEVLAPLKQLGCSQTMLAVHQIHRAFWLIGLFDNFKFLLLGPAPTALNNYDPIKTVRSY